MSLYQKASLVQIPSGYKAADAKLYSVVPSNGDGDFTVTVDADATRVNKDGLIESVAADQARLNYDFTNPQDPHLLLEPSRTNYLTNSNNASLWGQSTSNGTVTTTANYSTAPNGSNEATRLQASVSGGSGFALLSKSTTSFFGSYAATVYLKSTNGSSQEVCIYGRNTGNQVVTVTSEWQRFELNGSSTSGQSNFLNVGINTGFVGEDNPIDILVWGGQIEEGSYATSLIPTSGSAVTRTFDSCINGGDANLFNDTEGVLYANISAFGNDGTFRVLSVSDGSNNNIVKVGYRSTSDAIYYEVRSGGTTQAFQIYTTIDVKQFNKVAVLYQQNNFKLYINGTNVLSDVSGITPVGLNNLSFNADGAADFFGKVNEAIYFNEALTDQELIQLTS